MSIMTCELVESCKHTASYDLISRDVDGNELERVACCYAHGLLIIDANHEDGRPLPDCVITPATGIRIHVS